MRYYISLIAIAALGISILAACAQNASNGNAVKTNAVKTNTAAAQTPDDGAARITLEDAKKAFDAGNVVFVDTRAQSAYNQEHIKGAINIPTEAFATRYAEVPKDKKIIAYCS